ncbi:MAG: DUF4625 domain-containing protein [Prevotellaceae bacterium]|jgi:hypothetical protein|nr:DUF4625 domain-containing protein [Prevotellaceae bacterium]
MNKKMILGALLLTSVGLCAVSACTDDDTKPAKPVVAITGIGSHDGPEGTVKAGDELHLEADIVAEGLIARIDVEIHQEDGGSFEIEKPYTEGAYIGVKNATFHEHIDIPSEAPAGEYHLHLTVQDREGQTTTAEAELEIEAASE